MKKNFTLTGVSSVAMHTLSEEFAEYSHVTPIYATSTFTFDTAQQGMERFERRRVNGSPLLKIEYVLISLIHCDYN
jgi:O-acetylhomoserine/O-acetylserine sulfhydrylase-like pyridoxal-dependent enzyme